MEHKTRQLVAARSFAGAQTPDRVFDGVVCFGGEDWWYHNRGHFDMQMMGQLKAHVPVIYVNSLGMRVPSPTEGPMFVHRVARKLKSMRRGYVHDGVPFGILTPPAFPGRLGLKLSAPLIEHTLRGAMRDQAIFHPLVWVACPTAVDVALRLNPTGLVYQRTDRYERFTGVDAAHVRDCDARLKDQADLTVFCSSLLFAEEEPACRAACLVDHGVDRDRFVAASEERREPADVASLPHPRIGFVGGIDSHTFDPELLSDVAAHMPEATFVLVGASSLPNDWEKPPNVTMLGQRPLEEVPSYMAACDVLIMPWRKSSWIQACNPVKLKEYLASGRPIVSTDFPELTRYADLVRIADDRDGFIAAIRAALADPGDGQHRQAQVADQSWASKTASVLEELSEQGVRPASSPTDEVTTQYTGPRAGILRRRSEVIDLAAAVLLAGGLRPSALEVAAGISILDLPLDDAATVGALWLARFEELAPIVGRAWPIRTVHGARTPTPWTSDSDRVVVECEPRPFRGTAGLLHDLTRRYAADQHVLVAESARYLDGSLQPLLAAHAERRADITVGANADGSPSGVYLIRCGALASVPSLGYLDLKEQLLPRLIDAGADVFVHELAGLGAMPLRTREQADVASRMVRGRTPDDVIAQLEVAA